MRCMSMLGRIKELEDGLRNAISRMKELDKFRNGVGWQPYVMDSAIIAAEAILNNTSGQPIDITVHFMAAAGDPWVMTGFRSLQEAQEWAALRSGYEIKIAGKVVKDFKGGAA